MVTIDTTGMTPEQNLYALRLACAVSHRDFCELEIVTLRKRYKVLMDDALRRLDDAIEAVQAIERETSP